MCKGAKFGADFRGAMRALEASFTLCSSCQPNSWPRSGDGGAKLATSTTNKMAPDACRKDRVGERGSVSREKNVTSRIC